eukprot:m.116296 g.116296  ORF g.116296 m.116296 type:complete len:387 (+) comp28494_c0_seq2:28-1188(+)
MADFGYIVLVCLIATQLNGVQCLPSIQAEGQDLLLTSSGKVVVNVVDNEGASLKLINLEEMHDRVGSNEFDVAQLQTKLSLVLTRDEMKSAIDVAVRAAVSQLQLELNKSSTHVLSELDRLAAANLDLCEATCIHGSCVDAGGPGFACVCTANSGWTGPLCDVGPPTTSLPTSSPTSPPTVTGIASCSEASTSGVYTFHAGFQGYCFVGDNAKWMKISKWTGAYPMNEGAVNADKCLDDTEGGNFCKLSDDQINSVVGGDRGGPRYYRLTTKKSAQNMYLFTSHVYHDKAQSFNIGPSNARGMVRSEFDASTLLGATAFKSLWIDFLYVVNSAFAQQLTCERFFIGHGFNDCWREAPGSRCVRGGSACAYGEYAIIDDWAMWVALP